MHTNKRYGFNHGFSSWCEMDFVRPQYLTHFVSWSLQLCLQQNECSPVFHVTSPWDLGAGSCEYQLTLGFQPWLLRWCVLWISQPIIGAPPWPLRRGLRGLGAVGAVGAALCAALVAAGRGRGAVGAAGGGLAGGGPANPGGAGRRTAWLEM